jgi:cyclase
VKLFNDLEADELLFLDITATTQRRGPDYQRIRDIAGEAFMPITYGGGLRTVDHARTLFQLGVEKVAVTTAAEENPQLVTDLAKVFGSQSIVVGLDVGRDWLQRPRLFTRCGAHRTRREVVRYARDMQDRGAGELLLHSIDRDGTQQGYDVDLIESVCAAVNIPVIACGGAGSIAHLSEAVRAGASAAAAGSLFVFAGPHRAVLINYPSAPDLASMFSSINTLH